MSVRVGGVGVVVVDRPGHLVTRPRLGETVPLREIGEPQTLIGDPELVERVHPVHVVAGALVLPRLHRSLESEASRTRNGSRPVSEPPAVRCG